MHEVKVRKIGNSRGVILPAEVLERMNLEEGDTLFLVQGPESLTLTPYDPAMAETMEAFRRVKRKYRNALRDLAK